MKNKANDNLETRIKNLTVIRETARKELKGTYNKFNESKIELVNERLQEHVKNTFESQKELSKRVAEFRAKHSKEINAAAISDPRTLIHYIDRKTDFWFDGKERDAFMGGKYIHDFIEGLFNLDPRINGIDIPIIYDCPSVLTVDNHITITGAWFGVTTGTIYLDDFSDGDSDLRIDLTITNWDETSISFYIPDTNQIPFDAICRLYLERSDGKQTSIDVNIEPIGKLYYYAKMYSNEGMNWKKAFNPSYSHIETKTFQSPPLPESYKLFEDNDMDVPGLMVDFWNVSSITFPEESGGEVKVLNDLNVSGNKLNAKVSIIDDWYWDYTIRLQFYIIVPHGYTVDDQWQSNY